MSKFKVSQDHLNNTVYLPDEKIVLSKASQAQLRKLYNRGIEGIEEVKAPKDDK